MSLRDEFYKKYLNEKISKEKEKQVMLYLWKIATKGKEVIIEKSDFKN